MLHKCKIITVITGLGYETTAPGGGRQSRSWWAVCLEGCRGLRFFWRPLVRRFRARGGSPCCPTSPHSGRLEPVPAAQAASCSPAVPFLEGEAGPPWDRKLPALRGTGLRLGTPLLKQRAPPGGSSMGFMPARWPHDPLSREAPKVSRESFLEV